jgi:hypothetical protein
MTIWFPFSATIRQEEGFYISICPEADIICKGITIEEAIENLKKVENSSGKNCPRDFRKLHFTEFKIYSFLPEI